MLRVVLVSGICIEHCCTLQISKTGVNGKDGGPRNTGTTVVRAGLFEASDAIQQVGGTRGYENCCGLGPSSRTLNRPQKILAFLSPVPRAAADGKQS